MELRRPLRGALAGGAAAAVWAAQQPLDKHVFDCSFSDVELLGKLVTRDRAWPLVGGAIHLQNGAAFGALYALLGSRLPGPPVVRGTLAAMIEHAVSWPLGRLTDRYHPARRELVNLTGNRRALAQATWRHLVFGLVLGLLESRLNGTAGSDPLSAAALAAQNGHGDLEHAATRERSTS